MDSSHSPTVFPFRPPIAPCHWKPPRLAVRPILTSTIALALLSVALVSSTSDAVPPDAHLWNTNINLSDQIHQNTEQPTNPSPRSAESEDELLAALQSDISPESKRALFRDLRRLATDKSTSALAQLLSDTNFAHEARSVLEVIPGQRSTAALIRALRETKGNQLIGVVASLGNRRSPEAVQPLIALLSDRDPNVVRSAVSALGKIATDQALAALELLACSIDPPLFTTNSQGIDGSIQLAPQVRFRLGMATVVDALLECTEQLAQQGRTSLAAQFHERLASAQAAPWPGRIAAINALARSQPARATRFVLNMLREKDPSIQTTAASFAKTMSSEALEAIFSVLDACPLDSQIAVINAIGDRATPSDLPLIFRALRFPNPEARTAALYALPKFAPNPDMVLELARFASTDPPLSQAATDAIRAFPGEEFDHLILASLTNANGNANFAARIGLMRAACARSLSAALPLITPFLSIDNQPLYSETIKAIGQLGGEKEFELLVKLIPNNPNKTNVLATISSLVQIAHRIEKTEAAARMIAALIPAADKQTCLCLYDYLAKLAGPTALNTIRQAVLADDKVIKDHAIDLLTNWPDASPLDDLLAIAKTADSFQRHSMAIRGFIRLVGLPSARSPDQTLALYKQALEVALYPEDKKLVLPALAAMKHPDCVQQLQALLGTPELREAAASNLVAYAVNQLATAPSESLQLIHQITAAIDSPSIRAELDRLTTIITRLQQSPLRWEIAGPYFAATTNLEEIVETPFPPEDRLLPVKWTTAPTNDGFVRFSTDSSYPAQVVYLRTQLHSDSEQLFKLHFLLPGPARIWVNDLPLDPHPPRTLSPSLRETTGVQLRKGRNCIIVKLAITTGTALLACYPEQVQTRTATGQPNAHL